MTFSHDGLRDSLTHLAAPPFFYENLRRDLATADRNKSRITLIRFQIYPAQDRLENGDEEENQVQHSHYEVAILASPKFLKAI